MTYRNKLFVADTPERKTQKKLVAKNIKDDTASSRLGQKEQVEGHNYPLQFGDRAN